MQFSKVRSLLFSRLEKELPAFLTYHSVEHTKQVVEVTLQIAEDERVGEEEKMLVVTAALFHDAGFLNNHENHEEESCKLAADLLPAYEYTEDQVKEVCRLIMSTKSPQVPSDKLEKIICDADLSYLGTDSYPRISGYLYKELKHQKKSAEIDLWPIKQIQFLKFHKYFTVSANKRFGKKKDQNLKSLMKNHHTPVSKGNDTILVLQDFLLIVFGVIVAAFSLKGFLVPNQFFDGGITGISLLLHEEYHFNLGYIIVLANLPFILVSYFTVNTKFAIKTLVCVLLLGICLLYIPYPIITSDKLLISIFGGFFLGIGIGMTMRAGCALDGVEILALFTLKRTSFTITEIILGINVLIFVIAAFKFGMETALYSILTYFTASKTVDYVIEGIEAYTGVTIISSQSDIMKERLVNQLGRGITVYKGERGFLPGRFNESSDCDIIFTVVTRLEMRKLKNLVAETDPKAFVFASTIKEASGGILRRRSSH